MTIREHPLAWRWTDSHHAVLSEDALAQMEPIEQRELHDLFERSLRLHGPDSLSPQQFATIVRRRADVSAEVGTGWLREQQPDLGVRVFVCWQRDTALRTTWEIVTAHWSDFCYPSSDDVLVWPESEDWALLYHHEEEFQFGRRVEG